MSVLADEIEVTRKPAELLEMAERVYGHEEKARGAIFTKPAVVDFMLDLVGYTADKPLHRMRFLEPSFGCGQFVLHAVDRLVEAWRRDNGADPLTLRDALRAVELDEKSFENFGAVLQEYLRQGGFSPEDSKFLADSWLRHEDFLLGEPLGEFDFIVGNPPYVRQELVPNDLLQLYRAEFPTMVGRADLYIAFMERSLALLSGTGKLSFICADAWTRNDYGRGIRSKIAQNYALTHYVDMQGLDAFETKVGAYPSITVIVRGEYARTRVAHARSIDAHYLRVLSSDLLAEYPPSPEVLLLDAVRDAAPWLLSASPTVSVIAQLESHFPTLLEAGCRVGIGVATGADKVYIGAFDELDVEESRKLPLATNKDLSSGVVDWRGKGVVNPWQDEGGLVNLAEYPRLSAYLEQFRGKLSRRYTAKGDVERKWYKTIDRIRPSLVSTPKLLIPDIRSNGDAIAYDPGTLYPHHNLYFITSTTWDLRALQALLRSGVAHLFVGAYSVKIGGGYLRFQAQNLKRIRVPHWQEITVADQNEMRRAGESGEKLSVTLLERIYQLNSGTLEFLEED